MAIFEMWGLDEPKKISKKNQKKSQKREAYFTADLDFSLYLCLGDTPLLRPLMMISKFWESAVQHNAKKGTSNQPKSDSRAELVADIRYRRWKILGRI
jgi:hypothetical protein